MTGKVATFSEEILQESLALPSQINKIGFVLILGLQTNVLLAWCLPPLIF